MADATMTYRTLGRTGEQELSIGLRGWHILFSKLLVGRVDVHHRCRCGDGPVNSTMLSAMLNNSILGTRKQNEISPSAGI